jgi:hypothetical protein
VPMGGGRRVSWVSEGEKWRILVVISAILDVIWSFFDWHAWILVVYFCEK